MREPEAPLFSFPVKSALALAGCSRAVGAGNTACQPACPPACLPAQLRCNQSNSAALAQPTPCACSYELPALFNSVMLQYRVDRGTCVHRLFHEDNATHWIDGWGYGG